MNETVKIWLEELGKKAFYNREDAMEKLRTLKEDMI